MSNSQGEASCSTSTGSGGGGSNTSESSEPVTSSPHTKMGVENKLTSSSREMRNMAEKMRRDKLNNYITEIAGIVPLGSGANKRIDKTSVLRLAANYIRMHKILKEDDDTSSKVPPQVLGKEITHSLAEAVGGFLLVVTSSGKVVYITEAVDQFFGHTQVDLLGHSIYNVIHPDDHDIFQQQLIPKENCRRSFFCRMMEKALSRNDPGRYEIIHVVGQLKPLPQIQTPSCSGTSPKAPSPAALSPTETVPSSDHDDDDDESSDNEGEMQPLKITNKTGTHMLVSFVRVVKDRPITELSLVESTQDEYISRHGMDGKILYTDHRISFVTGLMPSEVVGTSAFNYMHQDDIVWSIVAQKLMFSSAQGQGIVSYRLRCRDGVHITLRSRGFLEVNKQTGQVESFVCINTVLSVKEASSEIKNQRRKLLPVIACHETEDHLGSISSSLPPELMIVLKQMMSPQMMQKMIESVKSSEPIPNVENSGIKPLPTDIGTLLNPTPENTTDIIKNTDQCRIGHPFQTKPKRPCSEVSYESAPDSHVRSASVHKDQWHRIAKKRSSIEDYSAVANKKFSFERDLPCPELLHPNYMSNTFSQQFSPRTSPQPHLSPSPSTSSVPENIKNYSSGTCQQYSSSGGSSHNGNNSNSGIHPKSPQQYQNAGALSPGNYWQHKSPAMPLAPGCCDQSAISSENCDRRLSQNLPSPVGGYSHRIAVHVPASPSYEQSKGDGVLSSGLSEGRSSSVSPHHDNHNPRISGGLPSPGNYNQSRSGAMLTSSHFIQKRDEAVSPLGSYNQSTCHSIRSPGYNQSTCHSIPSPGSYNQSTCHSIPSPESYSQNICQGVASVGSYSHNERKPNQSPQKCDQSVNRNTSCNVPSHCSNQYNVASPNDQATSVSQNQLFLQYQQASDCTPHTTNRPQHHPVPPPPQGQSFALSHPTIANTSPGHYCDPSHSQKQHSPPTRQLSIELESSHHAVPIISSHNTTFGEVGTSGVPAVPEPTIPEILSSCEEPLSKDIGRVFSNGNFQHYSSHNQQGGKLL